MLAASTLILFAIIGSGAAGHALLSIVSPMPEEPKKPTAKIKHPFKIIRQFPVSEAQEGVGRSA